MSDLMLMSWCPGSKCDPCKKIQPYVGNIWIAGTYCISPDGSTGGPNCIVAVGVELTLIPLNPPSGVISFTLSYTISGAALNTHDKVSATISATTQGYYGGGSFQGGLPLGWAPLPMQVVGITVDMSFPFAKNDAGIFYPVTMSAEVIGDQDFGPEPLYPNLFLEASDGSMTPLQYLIQ